jgi:hypothetical protein
MRDKPVGKTPECPRNSVALFFELNSATKSFRLAFVRCSPSSNDCFSHADHDSQDLADEQSE